MIKLPGQQDLIEVDNPVSLIDIYPSLMELCSLKGSTKKDSLASNIDGFSLAPFLLKNGVNNWDGPDGAFTMLGVNNSKHHINKAGVGTLEKQNFAYRTKAYRYILYQNGLEELYDLRNDPNEWHNVARLSDYEGVKTQLRMQLMKIRGVEK